MRFLLRLTFLLAASPATAWTGPLPPGQSPAQPARTTRTFVDIPRVETAPEIDHYLTVEGEGRPGLKVSAFLQRDPGDLTPPSQPTDVYLSYDAGHIYAIFICRASDPAKIRARMSRRESVFADDFVGLFLDTFNDRQRAYMFLVTPLGIQADGITTEGQGDDMSFDAVWHSRGRLTDFGYVVSMAVPFKSLRFPPGSGPKTWGIALGRSIPVANETDFWPGITNKLNGFASQFAEARGFEGVSPGRNIQLIPYGTFADARFLESGAIEHDTDGRAGIDAKIVVRDALTIDLTANPDFSQVESDEPQVTVNQRFEVFFPEKRPFFLENAGYFQTPIDLFFSRRIRDPQWGARATGKMAGWAVGAIAIDDRAPGKAVAEADPLRGDHAGNLVVRARREFGESSLGGLATARGFGSSFNRVASADARIKLNQRWVATGQAAISDSETLEGVALQSTAYSTNLNRSGRKFSYDLTYTDIGADFRSALGFVPRTDIRQATSFGALRWRPKTGPLLSWGPNTFVQATWDRSGVLQDWTMRFPLDLQFKQQNGVFMRHTRSMERFEGIEFDEYENMIVGYSNYLSWMDISVFYAGGTRPNYFPPTGITPFLANFRDASLSLTFRPLSGLLLDETYIYSGLTTRPGSGYTGPIFDNHIVRSRVNYQFTRELSVRGIVDYNAVLSNPSLVDLDRTKHLTFDVLATYLLNPGTAVYVGYTDGYDNVALDGAGGTSIIENPTTSTGRQFFVKLSYLFRF